MTNQFLSSINYWAVLVSGAAYWIIGSLWFSKLFGNIWSNELEKHGVKIKEPTKKELITKLILTLMLNISVSFGTAYFVYATSSETFVNAINLGFLLGLCFSAATIAIAYTWESRSLKLTLIDCGYSLVGITTCSVILTIWK